jgi:hypothetical protein
LEEVLEWPPKLLIAPDQRNHSMRKRKTTELNAMLSGGNDIEGGGECRQRQYRREGYKRRRGDGRRAGRGPRGRGQC